MLVKRNEVSQGEGNSSRYSVYFQRERGQGEWAPEILMPGQLSAYSVALSSHEKPTRVFWGESGSIGGKPRGLITTYLEERGWSEEQRLSSDDEFNMFQIVSVDDKHGNTLVAWLSGRFDTAKQQWSYSLNFRKILPDGEMSPSEVIQPISKTMRCISLAATSDDRTYLAWADDQNVYYSKRSPDTSWATPVSFIEGVDVGSLALLSNESQVVLMWSQPGAVYQMTTSNGEMWTPRTLIAKTIQKTPAKISAAVFKGNPVVSFADSTPRGTSVVFTTQSPEGNWDSTIIEDSSSTKLEPKVITNNVNVAIGWIDASEPGLAQRVVAGRLNITTKTFARASVPQISWGFEYGRIGVDSLGIAHVVWIQNRLPYYASVNQGGLVVAPEIVDSSGGFYSWEHDFFVDSHGAVHGVAVWRLGAFWHLRYYYRDAASDSWSTVEIYDGSSEPVVGYFANVRVVVNNNNEVFVAGTNRGDRPPPPWDVFLIRRDADDTWHKPEVLSRVETGSPPTVVLSINDEGSPRVVWGNTGKTAGAQGRLAESKCDFEGIRYTIRVETTDGDSRLVYETYRIVSPTK